MFVILGETAQRLESTTLLFIS